MIPSRRLSLFIFLLSVVFLYFPRYLGEVSAQKQSPSPTAFLSPGQSSISIQAAGRGTPWVNFQDGYALPSFYPPNRHRKRNRLEYLRGFVRRTQVIPVVFL